MSNAKHSLPSWIEQARAGWVWRGGSRPSFAKEPLPGEESVWDYPRPPLLVKDSRRVLIKLGEVVIVDTTGGRRLLETSHPPSWYLPRVDINMKTLVRVSGGSFCEWKGQAEYFDVVAEGKRIQGAAWAYPEPIDEAYAEIADTIAFYAKDLDCFVDGERVTPQPGGFYGGWITRELCGPFKGEPGSGGW